jgi:Flp pilus assembly protein TadG
MHRATQNQFRNQCGQSLVETALMIVVIFTVVFWVFELGWLMYTYTVMADAANEGVRHSIVTSGGDVTGTQAKVMTFARTSLHNVSSICVTVQFLDNNDPTPPNRVGVTVTYTYVPWLKVITPPTMTTYAEGRRVVQ